MGDMIHITARVDADIMSAVKDKAQQKERRYGITVTTSDMIREALKEFVKPEGTVTNKPKEAKNMAFISAQKMIEEHGRPTNTRARNSSADVVFATDITRRHRGRSPSPTYSVRFGLSEEVIKKARFMPGDKVDVLFDKENNAGLIRRTTSGGWTLSKSTTSARILIKFTWCPGLPTIASAGGCTDIQVTDEGIMFRFPEGTSFTRNARAEADAIAATTLSTAETLPIWQSRKFGK